MRPTKFWQILAAWALFSSIGMAQAHVGDLSTLRDIARAAHDNFQRRNYPVALGQFLSVWSKIKVPAVAYWVAQAYEQLGDRGKAALFYAVASQLARNEFWSDELVQLKAKTDATIRLNLVRQRVPQSLRLELTGNSAGVGTAELDGIEVPSACLSAGLPIEVGGHEISVLTGHGTRTSQRFNVSQAQQVVVTFGVAVPTEDRHVATKRNDNAPSVLTVLTTGPQAPILPPSKLATSERTNAPRPQQTLRWIAYGSLGVGAAGLLLGTTAGFISLNKHSELDDKCDLIRNCPPAVYDAKNGSYETWRNFATAGFVVGGLGVAVGGTLLLFSQRERSGVGWTVTLGPGVVRVGGAF